MVYLYPFNGSDLFETNYTLQMLRVLLLSRVYGVFVVLVLWSVSSSHVLSQRKCTFNNYGFNVHVILPNQTDTVYLFVFINMDSV